MVELQALDLIEASEASDEVMEWDDPVTAGRKLQRAAERALNQ